VSLVGDPAWTITADGGHLVITAGADAVWLVEDVSADTVERLREFWSSTPPAESELPAPAVPLVQHLAGLGALRPQGWNEPVAAVRVIDVGDPSAAFRDALARTVSVNVDAPTAVVVRTNAPLRALADLAAELASTRTPHVLCDLAFRQTLVLGPYVVPGDTSCLACLAGRVGTRWGDPDPPAAPAAAGDAELAATLVSRWARAGAGSTRAALVEATVSFDLENFSTRRESLWPVPSCPACAIAGRTPDDRGVLDLPWLSAASP
jgi:bacteriocin biosynthesis cyclodehydratase domain-containing protein